MSGFKVSFEDWAVQLKVRPAPPKIVVSQKGTEKKTIPVDKFEEMGMIVFPKRLVTKIREELRHANTYDRLMDKFYDWWDEQ